jgi:hypothetical protein
LHEVLAQLASLGVFDQVASPTAGALPGELWQALAQLGDGAWLDGHAGFDKGAPGNAQRWIERYLRGLAVPARDDPRC